MLVTAEQVEDEVVLVSEADGFELLDVQDWESEDGAELALSCG